MTKLTFIYISAIFLFSFIPKPSTSNSLIKEHKSKIYNLSKTRLEGKFHFDQSLNFLIAIVTGNSNKIDSDLLFKLKNLNLMHICTPSGLHLSSLFILLFPLLYILKRKKKKLFTATLVIIYSSLFLLPGFNSIHRIAQLKLLAIPLFRTWISSKFILFLIVFSSDIFFGTFDKSPLSFCLSYLFLGTILSIDHTSKGHTFVLSLIGAQIISSYFLSGGLSLIGSYLGIIITGLFSLFYPFLFFYFFFGHFFNYNYAEFLISLILNVVNISNEISTEFGIISITSLHLIAIVLFTFKRFYPGLVFIILSHSSLY